MDIGAQIKGLAHNKWALAGLAAAGGVGAYVLIKRKQDTGSTAADAGQASQQYAQAGTLDTTGTDLANWLGQQQGILQTQLDAYQKQLTDALGALGQLPTNGGQPTGTTPGPVIQGPVRTLPPRHQPTTVTVAKFTSKNPVWNSTLSGIASHYHTTVSALLKLNPSITNPNVIRTGQKIRVS